eukprot:TRINITY_DN8348_c0_g1_i1.p1 TRINITY_DN8348_c0_g1~~TRINITY_DN8348_c0_g1_i1.p1  ORF type:complete len:430 (-),score=47.05 TRINITY_DN8348_c0_g1_i1:73-1362(-)
MCIRDRSTGVLIVGGGIGGLSLANALKRIGVSYHLFDKTPEFGDVGFGLTLGANCMRAFEKINPDLEQRVMNASNFSPEMTSAVFRHDGRLIMDIPKVHGPKARYGPAQFIPILRSKLQNILLEDLDPSDISLSSEIADFTQDSSDGVTLTLSNGQTHHGEILIGADGIHSQTRKLLHQKYPDIIAPEPAQRYTNYTLYGGLGDFGIQPSKTFDWTLAPGGKIFVQLPMDENVPYWSFGLPSPVPLSNLKPWEKHNLSQKEWMLKETEIFNEESTKARALISKTLDYTCWDIYELARDKSTTRWGVGRVNLLGDAAHAVSPWVGQGAGISIEDAYDLAARIMEVKNETGDVTDWEPIFRGYEAQRIPRSLRLMAQARLSGVAFTTQSKFLRIYFNTLWKLLRSWESLFHKQMEWLYDFDTPSVPLHKKE